MNLQEHFANIRAFYRSHNRMPSYSELMARWQWREGAVVLGQTPPRSAADMR